KVNDGQADSSVVTVSITVNAVNDDPVAHDDSATTNESTPVRISVLDNDTDVDVATDGQVLTVSGVTQGSNGSVSNNGTSVTYSPNAHFYGSDSFSYTIRDGNGGTSTATVHVTVKDVTPPTTMVSNVSGKLGNNDWYTSAVTLTLSATDSASGVAATYFKVDN